MTDYSDSVIEYVNSISELNALANYGVSVAESVPGTDTSSGLNISSDDITESITTTDTSNGFATTYVFESMSETEEFGAIYIFNPKITDYLSPVDLPRVISYVSNNSLIESVSGIDSSDAFVISYVVESITESVSGTDTLDALISETVAESISGTDVTDASVYSNIVETVSAIDVISVNVITVNVTLPNPTIILSPSPNQVHQYDRAKLRLLKYTYRQSPFA
jgi:hypothetical protein